MPDTQGPPPLPVAEEDTESRETIGRMLAEIVSRAALSVPGVAALSPPHGLLRRRSGGPVRVAIGQGDVALAVLLTVRHEAIIPDLVADLRRRVARAVEQGTGYRVCALDLTIENILPPEALGPFPFSPFDCRWAIRRGTPGTGRSQCATPGA